MLDLGGYKKDTAGANFPVFVAGAKAGAPANHIIQFILAMWTVRVRIPGREYVQTSAHRRNTKEFLIQLAASGALPFYLGKFGKERLHARIPAKIRLVNCGTRLCVCNSPSGLYHW